MSGNFFRGISLEQDARFGNNKKKRYAQMTFPKNFSTKVDMKKVHREIINKWITEKITEILGFEDEIVVSLAINQFDVDSEEIDPRDIQHALTGFLEKSAPSFMEELWDLLLSAQANPTGIPTKFLEQKKEELKKKKEVEEEVSKKIKEKIEESRKIGNTERERGSNCFLYKNRNLRQRSRSRSTDRKDKEGTSQRNEHQHHQERRPTSTSSPGTSSVSKRSRRKISSLSSSNERMGKTNDRRNTSRSRSIGRHSIHHKDDTSRKGDEKRSSSPSSRNRKSRSSRSPVHRRSRSRSRRRHSRQERSHRPRDDHERRREKSPNVLERKKRAENHQQSAESLEKSGSHETTDSQTFPMDTQKGVARDGQKGDLERELRQKALESLRARQT